MSKAAADSPADPGTVSYTNKKALRDYSIEDVVEAGIVLEGAEVKSLRAGGGDLMDAYAKVEREELWLHGMKISPYHYDTERKADPVRPRKLLLHKREIRKLRQKSLEKGFTIIPLRAYFRDGKVKVEIGLAKGKKKYEQRETIAERDAAREMDRARKSRSREE